MTSPECCVADRIRASLAGFDRGALVAYQMSWHVVKRLSREDALELIETQITSLEAAVAAARVSTPGDDYEAGAV